MRRSLAASGTLTPQIEASLPVQAIDPLMIDPPALAPEQNVDSPETIADAHSSDLLHTSQQWLIVIFLGAVIPSRPALPKQVTGTAHAHTIAIDQSAYERLALRRL